MSINDMHPTELIEHRLKQAVVNENKSNEGELTRENGKKPTNYSKAAKGVREYNDNKELRILADESSYYDDLMGEM